MPYKSDNPVFKLTDHLVEVAYAVQEFVVPSGLSDDHALSHDHVLLLEQIERLQRQLRRLRFRLTTGEFTL